MKEKRKLDNEIVDSILIIEAEERLENSNKSKRFLQKEIDAEFGFNVLDLSKIDDIEIE